ncbi:MAG: DUF4911 domain-containing protein [Nitrospinota bacterium]
MEGPGPNPAAGDPSVRLYLLMPPEEVVFFQSVLEGMDNVAYMQSAKAPYPYQGRSWALVRLTTTLDFEQEVRELVRGLAKEVELLWAPPEAEKLAAHLA